MGFNPVRPHATLFLKNKVNEVVKTKTSFSCILATIGRRFVYTVNSNSDRHSGSGGTFYTWCMSANDERGG